MTDTKRMIINTIIAHLRPHLEMIDARYGEEVDPKYISIRHLPTTERVELFMDMSTFWGVDLAAEETDKVATVGDLVDLILSKATDPIGSMFEAAQERHRQRLIFQTPARTRIKGPLSIPNPPIKYPLLPYQQARLILTVGLPRSGKSTWAIREGYPVVNPDSIRLALHGQVYIQSAEDMVWTMAKYMTKSLFLAGHHTVIVDATNMTEKRRGAWVDDAWTLQFAYFDTSEETCIERAKSTGREDLIPVIKRMAAEFEPPFDLSKTKD